MTSYEQYLYSKQKTLEDTKYPIKVYKINSLKDKVKQKYLGFFTSEEDFMDAFTKNLEWHDMTLLIEGTASDANFKPVSILLAELMNCTNDELRTKLKDFFSKYPETRKSEILPEYLFNRLISEYSNKD